jgi:heptosyltransferase-2
MRVKIARSFPLTSVDELFYTPRIMMKLAIFLPNWIGDTCMATPALRALRSGLSRNVQIIGVARPGPAALMEDQPWLDDCIVYQPRAEVPRLNRRRLVHELNEHRFDAALLFPNSLSSALIAALARIPRKIGFAGDGRSWLLTERIRSKPWKTYSYPTPAIDQFLQLAEHMGCPSIDRNMELCVDEKYTVQAEQLWKAVGFHAAHPTVVINNNAATSPARLWPTESVVKLAQKLVRQADVQVLFHCGPRERKTVDEWVRNADHPRIQSMGKMPELPLGLSLAVMKRASLVISTDSGARLLAVALDRQVVSLFGPTKPEFTVTYNRPEIQLRAKDPCIASRKTPPHKNESGGKCTCMKQISVDQVYDASITQLRRSLAGDKLQAA